jgi:hypothetical protein
MSNFRISRGGRPPTAHHQTWDKPARLEGNVWIDDETPQPGHTYTRATWPPRGRGRGESLYSPRRIEAKLRAIRVIELRIAGHTWDDIAHLTGFKDASGPYRAFHRAMDRVNWDRHRRDEMDRY